MTTKHNAVEIYDKLNFIGETDASDKDLFVSGYRYNNGRPLPIPRFGSKQEEIDAATAAGTPGWSDRLPAFSMERGEDGGYKTRPDPVALTPVSDDAVNHPAHYNSHPSSVECIEIVRHMTFNTGSVFKYLWRAGLKDGNPSLQDYRKALWYLQDEIARLEKEEKNGSPE